MKLAITIEVDIDLVAWGDEYDIRGVPEIKADVRSYIEAQLLQSAAGEAGAIKSAWVSKLTERKSI